MGCSAVFARWVDALGLACLILAGDRVAGVPWPEDATVVECGDKLLPADAQEGRAIAGNVLHDHGRTGGYWVRSDGSVQPVTHAPFDAARPSGLRDVVDVDVGSTFAVALRSDGSAVWWGTMSDPTVLPRSPIVVPE